MVEWSYRCSSSIATACIPVTNVLNGMGGMREGGCTHIQMWKYIWMVNQQALPTWLPPMHCWLQPCWTEGGCSSTATAHSQCLHHTTQPKVWPRDTFRKGNAQKRFFIFGSDPRVLTIAWVIQPPIIDLDHHHHCDVIICLAAISRKIHQCFGLKCHWKF